MMIHRCSDNGWRNGRLAPVHVNEGKCKECGLFITMIRGLFHWKSTLEAAAAFHPGLNTSKGHMEDKYACKANICEHALPLGIICQLLQVCLYVQVSSLKL